MFSAETLSSSLLFGEVVPSDTTHEEEKELVQWYPKTWIRSWTIGRSMKGGLESIEFQEEKNF